MMDKWHIFESRFGSRIRSSDAAWAESLSPDDRLAIVEELYDAVRRTHERAADWHTVEALTWQNTLAERRRLVALLHSPRKNGSSPEIERGRPPVADAG